MKSILNIEYSIPKLFLVCYLYVLIPISGALTLVMTLAPHFGIILPTNIPSNDDFTSIVLVAPLLETGIMVVIIRALNGFALKDRLIIYVTALIFGAMHLPNIFNNIFSYFRFYVGLWSFYVFASMYINVKKTSPNFAFITVVLLHVSLNLTNVILSKFF